MANILFTFANEDMELTYQLADYLKKDGHEILYPSKAILLGRVLNEFSLKLNTTDFLIVVLTKNSINSKLVLSEISTAIGYYQERKKPRIIPIIFDDVSIPEILMPFQGLRTSRDKLEGTAIIISNDISEYVGKFQAIDEEKKETIDRVTEISGKYISESISRLELKEKIYRRIAYLCYSLCGISLIVAIVFILFKANFLLNSKLEITSSKLIQLSLLGFVLLALIVSISRFLFLIGKSFMVESLRNSDRIHAISFGEFYLKAFGDKADWNEIKDAFQHWNIDKGSTFISQSANDFDPEIFKNIIEFTKLITKSNK
ncbi:TIR domain-containing protein [Bacillus sp. CGMCC 1.16607]|uniref:TIR domain-containing protein n=1 Tax=Bacillus sp. CGMCC 1.16607 TaxID=3351842 RepID=UPI00363D7CD1